MLVGRCTPACMAARWCLRLQELLEAQEPRHRKLSLCLMAGYVLSSSSPRPIATTSLLGLWSCPISIPSPSPCQKKPSPLPLAVEDNLICGQHSTAYGNCIILLSDHLYRGMTISVLFLYSKRWRKENTARAREVWVAQARSSSKQDGIARHFTRLHWIVWGSGRNTALRCTPSVCEEENWGSFGQLQSQHYLSPAGRDAEVKGQVLVKFRHHEPERPF